MTPDEKTHPVASWATACNVEHDAIFLSFNHLARPEQTLEQAQRGKIFALTSGQARKLVADIQKQLERLEIGIPPSSHAE